MWRLLPAPISRIVLSSVAETYKNFGEYHFQGTPIALTWTNGQHGEKQQLLLRSSRLNGLVGPEQMPEVGIAEIASQMSEIAKTTEDLYRLVKKNVIVFDTGDENKRMHCQDYVQYNFLGLNAETVWASFKNLRRAITRCSTTADLVEAVNTSKWQFVVGLYRTYTQSIIDKIKSGHCIIIQNGGPSFRYSDSILSCLVQLMLDPYYRSIKGFLQLIRKDWFLESNTPHLITPSGTDVPKKFA